MLIKVHSKNPESESYESNSGAPKFVRDFCKNHLPKPTAYQQRRQKEGKAKNPSQASSSALLFISLCSCVNDPVLDTPTPFHKHAYSGLPIKGATLSHKIHLHYFSENRRHAVNNLCHIDYQPYFSGNSKQTPLLLFQCILL